MRGGNGKSTDEGRLVLRDLATSCKLLGLDEHKPVGSVGIICQVDFNKMCCLHLESGYVLRELQVGGFEWKMIYRVRMFSWPLLIELSSSQFLLVMLRCYG